MHITYAAATTGRRLRRKRKAIHMTALRLQTADVRHQIPGPPLPRPKARLRGAGYIQYES